MKKIIIGLTGASGSIYFSRLCEYLSLRDVTLHLIASELGEKVFQYETGHSLKEKVEDWSKTGGKIVLEDNQNMFSAVASGSARFDAMAIIPCSMSTLAMISQGITQTLLTRAADVMLKERKRLVVVPRETPLSTLHLKNMTELSQLGAVLLPAMPGFYGHPQTLDDLVDFVVGKTLDCLEIEHNYYHRWEGQYEE